MQASAAASSGPPALPPPHPRSGSSSPPPGPRSLDWDGSEPMVVAVLFLRFFFFPEEGKRRKKKDEMKHRTKGSASPSLSRRSPRPLSFLSISLILSPEARTVTHLIARERRVKELCAFARGRAKFFFLFFSRFLLLWARGKKVIFFHNLVLPLCRNFQLTPLALYPPVGFSLCCPPLSLR